MKRFINVIHHRDKKVLKFFNTRFRTPFFDKLMPGLTFFGSTEFSIVFFIVLFFIRKQTAELEYLFWVSLFSITICGFITYALKRTFNRVRPYMTLDDLSTNKIGIDNYSFPSGHTSAAFSIATAISICFPSLSAIVLSIATLVGISRMYLGVHYPTDILAGFVIGSSPFLFVGLM